MLNIAQSDVLTSAEYPWRQIAINVVASGLEMRINKGDTQIIALVKSRVKNADPDVQEQLLAWICTPTVRCRTRSPDCKHW